MTPFQLKVARTTRRIRRWPSIHTDRLYEEITDLPDNDRSVLVVLGPLVPSPPVPFAELDEVVNALVAEVTASAVVELGLQSGSSVWLSVKATDAAAYPA